MKILTTLVSIITLQLIVNAQECTSSSTGTCTASNGTQFKAGCENGNVNTVTVSGSFTVNAGNIRIVSNNNYQVKTISTNGEHDLFLDDTELRITCENFIVNGDYNSDNINDLSFTGTPNSNIFTLTASTPKQISFQNINFEGTYSRGLYVSSRGQDLGDMDFQMQNCNLYGFTEKGIVFNRRERSFTEIEDVRIYNNSFTPSPNARTDGQYRAISFDAGNDMEDCGILCQTQASSNGVAETVSVSQRLKVSGNEFNNCGIAFARYEHISIDDSQGANVFYINKNLPATNSNFKYKCLNIENASNDVEINGNIFSIERTGIDEGYTRMLFVGSGSEWIKNDQAEGANNDDGDYNCTNVQFTNNTLLPAVNLNDYNQVLDYMYVKGVKNMTVEGNDFNNRISRNIAVLFDGLGAETKYIAGNTGITIGPDQEIYAIEDCKPLKVLVRTENCSEMNIAPAETIVTKELGGNKCNLNQCSFSYNTVGVSENNTTSVNGPVIAYNPVEDYIVLTETASVEIYTLAGLKVMEFDEYYASNSKINIADLPAGIYLLNATFANGESIIQKIVKR